MFAVSGSVLALTIWSLFRPGHTCLPDPELVEQCEKVRRWNIKFYWISIGTWLAGFATAYLALPIYSWLEGGRGAIDLDRHQICPYRGQTICEPGSQPGGRAEGF